MTFRVGMKVTRLDARPFRPMDVDEVAPVFGEVYTIRGMEVSEGELGLCFEEIRNPKRYATGIPECIFRASRFRPAVSPGISFDASIPADPDSEQYDNRRRIPARVREWGASA